VDELNCRVASDAVNGASKYSLVSGSWTTLTVCALHVRVTTTPPPKQADVPSITVCMPTALPSSVRSRLPL
jgi:hypothetical protein